MTITHSGKYLILLLIVILVSLEFSFCDDSIKTGTDSPPEFAFELVNLKLAKFRLSGRSGESVFPLISNVRMVLLGITADNGSSKKVKETGVTALGLDYFDFGMGNSYFNIGPVYTCGLLREIDNPLGYSPWSDVRLESTGLKLNGSFPLQTSFTGNSGYPGSRHGISYSVFPDLADIYVYRKGRMLTGSSPLHLGVNARLQILPETSFGGRVLEGKAEVISALTEPFTLKEYQTEESDYAEEWYPDNFPFPGGKLFHFGSRFLFTSNSLKRLKRSKGTQSLRTSLYGDKLSVYYSLIGSGGTLIKPGILSEGFAAWESAAGKLGLFGGYRSEGYRNTKGSASRNRFKITANLQLFPLRTDCLSLGYEGLLKHPSFERGKFIEGEEKIVSNISWLLVSGFKDMATVSIEGEKRLFYSKEGCVSEDSGLTAVFLYRREHEAKGGKSGIEVDFDILENAFDFNYYAGGNKVAVNISEPFSEFFGFKALYSGYFNFRKYKLYWEVKTEPVRVMNLAVPALELLDAFSYLNVSIGWETRHSNQ